MARGDYFDIWLRGEGKPRRVQATRIGATVNVDMGMPPPVAGRPSAPSEFIGVFETAATNPPSIIREFHFARSEVVAIEQGNEMLKTRKK